MEQAGRKTRLLEQAHEEDAPADRRARIRLQHHRVAEGQGRGECPDGEHDRGVEWCDDSDHAHRQPTGERQARLRRRKDTAQRGAGKRGGLPELLRRTLDTGPVARHAGLLHHPPGQLIPVFLQQVGCSPQHGCSAVVRGGRPSLLGVVCEMCGPTHVSGTCHAYVGEVLPSRGRHRRVTATASDDPTARVDLSYPISGSKQLRHDHSLDRPSPTLPGKGGQRQGPLHRRAPQ